MGNLIIRIRYLLVIVTGFGFVALFAQDQPVSESTSTGPLATVEEMRLAIVNKNIFLPERIPDFTYPKPHGYDTPSVEFRLRPLDRPFSVTGFRLTDDRAEAFLHFADHSEDRIVVKGDEIEFITVLEVEPPYLLCDYAGREVRITSGQGSRDAYLRLTGFGSDCHLIGTTMLPSGSFAQFYFPTEGIYRRVEEGNVLGNATVIKIEWGQVIVELNDGTFVPLKTNAAGKFSR